MVGLRAPAAGGGAQASLEAGPRHEAEEVRMVEGVAEEPAGVGRQVTGVDRHHIDDPVDVGVHDRVEEAVLVAEVVVDEPLVCPRGRGDSVDARAGDPALCELGGCGRQEPLLRRRRVPAWPCC